MTAEPNPDRPSPLIAHDAGVLAYETPGAATGFAAAPTWCIVLMAVLVPGLASVLICGRRRVPRMLLLCFIATATFAFFGLIWGEILFVHTRWSEAGLYPFIIICATIIAVSVLTALRHQRSPVGV